MSLLTLSGLTKSFASFDGERKIIVDVPKFSLTASQQLALRGASSSGKTTFLHLITSILKADSGTIRLGTHNLTTLSESKRDRVRAQNIGYISSLLTCYRVTPAWKTYYLAWHLAAKPIGSAPRQC